MMRMAPLLFLFLAHTVAAEEISPERRSIRISNGKFLVQGVPTFLLGISYYDGMTAPAGILQSDLNFLKARGFNAIRVWATWYSSQQPRAIPVFRRNGTLNPAGWNRLERLLKIAKNRGFVVDLTFSRDGLQPISFENYSKGIRATAVALRPYQKVLIDIQNETNTCGLPEDSTCSGHLTLQQVAQIRNAVKVAAPGRLVTASRNSYGFVPGQDDYGTFRNVGKVDFVATHRPSRTRDAAWAQATDDETRLIRNALGPAIPILFDEPNRCGRNMDCTAASSANVFLLAAANARRAGAAGWFFHTDAGFRLHARPLAAQLNRVERVVVDRLISALSQTD